MRKYLLAAFGAAVALGAWVAADAASVNVTVSVGDPTSTAVTCTPGALTAPVAAGTTVCAISVTPSAWASPPGTLTLSGTNAADFAINGTNLVVASGVTLSAGSYTINVTATP